MSIPSKASISGLGAFVSVTLLFAGCAADAGRSRGAHLERIKNLQGTFGTYDAEPRKADRRVDVDRLVGELTAIKANTYNFLIWHGSNDWEDCKLFLPKAREKRIKVWITLVPPSESPPHTSNYSEPFCLDYQRWAVEIARLSVKEPNLVAWSFDDFSYSSRSNIFTTSYMETMMRNSRAINPKLAFVPCLYFTQVTPQLAAKYKPFLDGILFPYRHEAGGWNLSEWNTLEAEVARVRERFRGELPVFVDVYATKHAKLNDSSAEYVRQVMTIGRRTADGVLIYCHQYEARSPKKYQVIKRLFQDWAAEDAMRLKTQNETWRQP